MYPAFFFSAIVASFIVTVAGFLVNLFITAVGYRTWLARRSLSPSDQILLSLASARLLMLGLFLLNMTCFLMAPGTERSVSVSTFFLLSWMFLDSSTLWLVTLLNTLYCVKITNFQHPVFLLLKQHLSLRTPRLLLACVLTPALTTLLFFVLSQVSPLPELGTKKNSTVFDINEDVLSLVASLLLNALPQFVLNVTSASLLINSLQRHIRKMRRNATGVWSPQTAAHVGAVKLMSYFLVLYIPHSVASLVHYLPSSVGLAPRTVCVIISSLYSPGHSILLILTHPKLKTKAKQVLCFHQ
ncbi:PREDICTED: taste receptor type 2 member 4-like [Elephantulus edwardii]|uniref:taste receptor type 2 member 4-like n=1 Tax=Elephantulus edwardii TaxID=28737 RepID=UPI0003F05A7B|nr:PREDICTED: taste receptor type 2 member 4-like [Elephantulus edwardii]